MKIYAALSLLPLLLYSYSGIAQLSSQPQYSYHSGKNKVSVIELFSSQGCSSCPPAEQWMSRLKAHSGLWKDIVPLVFHADYWDRLGWIDPYSSPSHSLRQHNYHRLAHSNAIYTPEFILNGEEWQRWFQQPVLPNLTKSPTAELNVTVFGPNIDAQFTDTRRRKLQLNIAILGIDIVTPIKHGENRGINLSQDFIVLEHLKFESTTNTWQLTLPKTRYAASQALAFWVSDSNDPTPLQATGGWW